MSRGGRGGGGGGRGGGWGENESNNLRGEVAATANNPFYNPGWRYSVKK